MKLAIAILALSSVLKVVCGTSAPPGPSLSPLVRINVPAVALTHVTLFDGSEGPAKHDQTVVIDHGRIAAVGPTASVGIPPGASVLDESGKTLLPGLVGMHEHLFYISAGGGPGHLLLGTEQAESAPRLYLAAGITTARTTRGNEPATDLALKRAIEQGTQAGPDLDVTGPYLDGRPHAILQNQ
jgi:imidazolonepropionase-like amidohydrolase